MSRSGKHELSVVDHDRNSAELTYVYPVVSRRAGGVSIGVNLNPNNACNRRCVYCQVPDLVFGKAPRADLELLETELRQMFDAVLHGDFMAERVPESARNLRDVAFSGNGEPTSCLELDAALETVASVLGDFGLLGKLPVVLITNGSLLHLPRVQAALGRLSGMGGEVWFKLDSATELGARRINSCQASPQEHLNKLRAAASLCKLACSSGTVPNRRRTSKTPTWMHSAVWCGTRSPSAACFCIRPRARLTNPKHRPCNLYRCIFWRRSPHAFESWVSMYV